MVKGLADSEGKSLIIETRFSGAWLIEPSKASPEMLAEGSLSAQHPTLVAFQNSKLVFVFHSLSHTHTHTHTLFHWRFFHFVPFCVRSLDLFRNEHYRDIKANK